MDWTFEALFRVAAVAAPLATWAAAGRMRERAVKRVSVTALVALSAIAFLLSLPIVGLSGGELESLGFEFLLPVYIAFALIIEVVVVRLALQGGDRGRLLLVGLLWLLAGITAVAHAAEAFFLR